MIQLYRRGDPEFKLDSKAPSQMRMVTKAVLERKAMEQDTVNISVASVAPIVFEFRDYIVCDGRPYFINLIPKLTKLGTMDFTYDITFEGGLYELGRVFFSMAGLRGWDYVGDLHDFCSIIVNEMNRNSLVVWAGNYYLRYTGEKNGIHYRWSVVGQPGGELYSTDLAPAVGSKMLLPDLTPGPTVTEVGGLWTLDFELDEDTGDPVETEEKTMDYFGRNCLEVIHDLVSQWDGWEFAVEVRDTDLCNIDSTVATQCGGTLILRRKTTVTGDTTKGIFLVDNKSRFMSFGKTGGVEKVVKTHLEDSNLPSRVYFYGGDKNIPPTYRNTRLCLPGKGKELSYIDTGYTENAPCETVKTFDDIFPACKPFVLQKDGILEISEKRFIISMPLDAFFDIFAKWKDPVEATPSEYGSYLEWKLMYGSGNESQDLMRYYDYYFAGWGDPKYPLSCYLVEDSVRITFQTGDLAGHSFVVSDFFVTQAEPVVEPGGDPVYAIILACEGMESLYDDNSYMFPNSDIICKAGDSFVVEGCLMPASYVYAGFGSGNYDAETMLQDAADKYIAALGDNVSVEIGIADGYIISNNAAFRLYDRIILRDSDVFGPDSIYLRVEKVNCDILEGTYKVDVTDAKGSNPFSKLTEYTKKVNSVSNYNVKVKEASVSVRSGGKPQWNDI